MSQQELLCGDGASGSVHLFFSDLPVLEQSTRMTRPVHLSCLRPMMHNDICQSLYLLWQADWRGKTKIEVQGAVVWPRQGIRKGEWADCCGVHHTCTVCCEQCCTSSCALMGGACYTWVKSGACDGTFHKKVTALILRFMLWFLTSFFAGWWSGEGGPLCHAITWQGMQCDDVWWCVSVCIWWKNSWSFAIGVECMFWLQFFLDVLQLVHAVLFLKCGSMVKLLWNGACAHYVMVSKFQWKPFWLATQRDLQNDWTATQNRVNYDVFAQAPFMIPISLSSSNFEMCLCVCVCVCVCVFNRVMLEYVCVQKYLRAIVVEIL